MKNGKKAYLPKVRTCYTPENNIKSSNNPKAVDDPIVCNNIAWQEFDYTESMDDDK